ncbi:uncharacterized protein LOC127576512 [Pristis pectinata]|uniref:uncharacterized protein LOC127576512 n=1 Tax=Pristis pectinata TaxID=685728 RepID=UPI00223D58B8|nr:uncharacterized protein LOC127576512 [Pristis pectinata]
MGVASYLCLLLSCLAGVRSDVVLTQPASAVVKPGESYTLTCEVSGFDLSSYGMSWVKQVSGKGLDWLAGISSGGSKDYAPGVRGRFEVSKDSSTVYLQMNSLRPDDTATYYCTSDTVRGSGTGPGQKPSESARPQGAEGQDGTDHRSRVPALLCRRRPSLEWEACCQPRFLGGEAGGTEGLSGSLQRAARSQAPWVGLESPIGPVMWDIPRWWGAEHKLVPTIRPPKLIPLVPSPEFIHNQTTAVLGCVISGFSPDDITVSWKKAGSTQTGIVLPSTSTTDGGFETVTYLRVPVQEWISKLEYTCEVTQTSAGFREKVNMRYQDGGPCPSCCSECVPMFLYQTDLNATFSDGSTQHYHCLEGKCEIK